MEAIEEELVPKEDIATIISRAQETVKVYVPQGN